MGQAINKTVAIAEIIKVCIYFNIFTLSPISSLSLSSCLLAIYNQLAICIIEQKRIPQLHQDTAISSVSITDTWEPIEEGLVP